MHVSKVCLAWQIEQCVRQGIRCSSRVERNSPKAITCYHQKLIIFLELDLSDIRGTYDRVLLELNAVCKLLTPLLGAARMNLISSVGHSISHLLSLLMLTLRHGWILLRSEG